MCGIVGFIAGNSGNSLDKELFMRQALIADTLRGEDSTGIFTVLRNPNKKKESVSWYKAVMDGYSFVASKDYDEFLGFNEVGSLMCAVGHNRAATIGGVSMDTAHPFQEGPITLVHNGTLQSTSTLPQDQTETGAHNDSHTVAKNLAAVAPDKAHEIVGRLDGAYALVWYDERTESLSIVRNNARPMSLGYSPQTQTIYFASEPHMLRWLDMRINLGINKIYGLKSHKLMTFTKGTSIVTPTVQNIVDQAYRHRVGHHHHYHQTGYSGKVHGSSNAVVTLPTPQRQAPATPFKRFDQQIAPVSRWPKMSTGLQEMLLNDFDLLPETPIDVIPYAREPYVTGRYGTTRWIVYGKVCAYENEKIHGIDVVMPNVMDHSFVCNDPPGMSRMWTCLPIAPGRMKGNNKYLMCDFVRPVSVSGEIKPAREIIKLSIGNRRGNVDSTIMLTPISTAIKAMTKERQERITSSGKEPVGKLDYNDEDNPTMGSGNMMKGPGGAYVPFNMWIELTKDGCANCTTPLGSDEEMEIMWTTSDTGRQDPLCADCQLDQGFSQR